MSEQSLRTKKNYQEVWELYNAKLKALGKYATKITRSTIYDEISDVTEYSQVTVKRIINGIQKTKSKICVCF